MINFIKHPVTLILLLVLFIMSSSHSETIIHEREIQIKQLETIIDKQNYRLCKRYTVVLRSKGLTYLKCKKDVSV